MKKFLKPNDLPVMTAALGGLGLVLRRLVYAFAVDEKNLFISGHPLEILLALVTAAALMYIFATVRKLDGSNRYVDNFQASVPALVGHGAAAVGIFLTVLFGEPGMRNYLGVSWKIMGFISPVCLLLAGCARMQGKRPFFLLHLFPCLFLMFHIVNHYQVWSGNPQILDYSFELFGTMALMLFAYYSAAFDVGSGRRRMHLGAGLAAVYLCMAELALTEYPWLYLGGIAWALTGLCTRNPKPKQPPKQPKEEA